ncbi:hypothetical protein KCM76_25590 [Zooshikella marina]|uniref:hypothetical protein n=1 Tax=Zooshikella ganghwensis TaxID=202772 RepID=UPI001BAE838E|nr:hypothetical protein [Zooshikella ganghwensis]MBU2709390.1 hypothetical protein [Zooshikella ganghwensis]
MSEYRYTKEDRKNQLCKLIPALEALISHLNNVCLFAEKIPVYEQALAEANRLLNEGFTQEELNMLNRGIPDLFNRHKEWYPPLEDESNELSKPAKWFEDLEQYLQPVREAAGVLSIIGYY